MKKILYVLTIITIFLITPKVKAFNLDSSTPLVYGNQTYGYNWSSSSSWTSLDIYKSSGYDGGVYYTNPVATGTNGISFGMFLNGMLLPNHYYRLTYVGLNVNGVNCGSPASWDNQLRFGTGMGNSSLVSRTYSRLIGINNNVTVYFDDPDATYNITGACTYTFVFSLSGNATFMNLPFNTTSSTTSDWRFYGYYIEDIGSTDTVTNSQLQTTITNIQNSINANSNANTQNIINNQNQNAQQAHQDAQNTQNAINGLKDDTVDSNTGKSFFDNFSDNSHGLSGIITAPLNIIRQLINVNPTSCSALSTTYHNKTISMECGKIFWGHTGFSDFNVFYNMVVGGAFCYLIIKDLFLTIEKLKDPDNDKVEVMDL